MTHASDAPLLAFRDIDDVARALRERGGRFSATRRRVLEVLFSAPGPVSAEHIARAAGAMELTTVYRSVERLEELGVVRHVHLGHGPGLYALSGSEDREYLVCDSCARVEVTYPAALERVRDVIRQDFGYEARFGHFAIHGVCAACARAPRNPARRGGRMSSEEHPHEESHTHQHSHGDVVHEHPHESHDHDHVEHEHQHSHGDVVHAHEHAHEAGLEEEHSHSH